MIKKIIVSSILFFLPTTLAHAQVVTDIFDVEGLVMDLLTSVGYFFWVLAIAAFFWGLVKFIKNAGDSKEHEEGKHLIVWGLISFLVLVSLWAIVQFILDDLGVVSAPVCYIDKNGIQICP